MYQSATLGSGIGLYIDGSANGVIDTCVFEANGKEALKIYPQAATDNVSAVVARSHFENNHLSEATPGDFFDIVADGSIATTYVGVDISITDSWISGLNPYPKAASFKTVQKFYINNCMASGASWTANTFKFASSCYGEINLPYYKSDARNFIENDGTNVIMSDDIHTVAISDGDTSPDVTAINVCKTGNTNPTTITALDKGYVGQKVTVIFGDALTTVDFTGTWLKGNAGVDKAFGLYDSMTCVRDDTGAWYCTLALAS
jgi:hypothetical protein